MPEVDVFWMPAGLWRISDNFVNYFNKLRADCKVFL